MRETTLQDRKQQCYKDGQQCLHRMESDKNNNRTLSLTADEDFGGGLFIK